MRKYQWIEIDIARRTGLFALDGIDRQRSHINLLPVRGPLLGRVRRRIAWLA